MINHQINFKTHPSSASLSLARKKKVYKSKRVSFTQIRTLMLCEWSSAFHFSLRLFHSEFLALDRNKKKEYLFLGRQRQIKNAQTEGKKFNFSSLNAFFIIILVSTVAIFLLLVHCSFEEETSINNLLLIRFKMEKNCILDLSKKMLCEIKTPIKEDRE